MTHTTTGTNRAAGTGRSTHCSRARNPFTPRKHTHPPHSPAGLSRGTVTHTHTHTHSLHARKTHKQPSTAQLTHATKKKLCLKTPAAAGAAIYLPASDRKTRLTAAAVTGVGCRFDSSLHSRRLLLQRLHCPEAKDHVELNRAAEQGHETRMPCR